MQSEERDTAYDDFAWFYDRYWRLKMPGQMLGVLDRLLLPRLAAGAHILDVCCGTGWLAGELAERGFRITGIDRSQEMLRYARRNAPAAEFIAADVRWFALPARCDAAVSVFDSLNHVLSLDELGQVFRNVHAALAPKGLFLFDLNMERSFALYWRGNSFTTVEPDHASIIRGTYDTAERLGRIEVTLFRLRGDQWQRTDLTIAERCHAEDGVRAALVEAGFDVETFEAERDLHMAEHVGRVFFLATRR